MRTLFLTTFVLLATTAFGAPPIQKAAPTSPSRAVLSKNMPTGRVVVSSGVSDTSKDDYVLPPIIDPLTGIPTNMTVKDLSGDSNLQRLQALKGAPTSTLTKTKPAANIKQRK